MQPNVREREEEEEGGRPVLHARGRRHRRHERGRKLQTEGQERRGGRRGEEGGRVIRSEVMKGNVRGTKEGRTQV